MAAVSNIPLESICVYCGSADNLDPIFIDSAAEIGRLLAVSGRHLVYGAGKTGLMGAVADGVLRAGGRVTGVTPEHLNTPQLIHTGLTRLEVTPDIQTRKARMFELADGFIALPGGYGTLDELFETLTWAQIGLHTKPVGLLNTSHYYDPLLEMINLALQKGFIYAEHQVLFVHDTTPAALLQKLCGFVPPSGIERWVNR